MRKPSSTVTSFAVACFIAAGIVYSARGLPDVSSMAGAAGVSAGQAVSTAAHAATREAEVSAGQGPWAASAPGRVEPKGGEIRIASQLPGKIVDVTVVTNDVVAPGDLLFRLDDEEYRARLEAASAEAAVRIRERDQENVGKAARDRRTAEDALENAKRSVFAARMDLDRVMANARAGQATGEDVARAREAVAAAEAQVGREREAVGKAASAANLPLPTRLEAGLSVARAELAVAETALARTRVRSPIAGTVLRVNARVGEMAAPTPEQPLVVIGDLANLRVRAELVERDIDKVRVGQTAVVTSDAFPGRQFEARVTEVGRAMSLPHVSQRGPRRPQDVEVLEVLVDLVNPTPLLPGMRTDVFFRPETATAGRGSGEVGTGGADASAPKADPATRQ